MSTDVYSLARLIAPNTLSSFFESYWERDALVVHRDDPHYFDSLLTLDEVDRVISTFNLSHPDITLANANRQVRLTDYTHANGAIDVGRLYQQFAAGGSIVMNQLHRFVPALAAMCRDVEREVSSPLQTNIYLTPRESQGFRVHYDSHDVIVLQVHGTKQWTLYDTAVVLPLRGQAFGDNPVEPGPITREFEMRPGDTLYLPRGLMHHAQTTSSESLHVTVGVLHTSWAELLIESVARLALAEPALRKGLPVGHANEGFDRAEMERTFRELLGLVAAKADLHGALDLYADDMATNRPMLLRGQLQQVCRLGSLTADDRVELRPHVSFRTEARDEGLAVSFGGRELTLPAQAVAAARHILSSAGATAIRDLPGDLDESGRLVLVRRLVREGLARVL